MKANTTISGGGITTSTNITWDGYGDPYIINTIIKDTTIEIVYRRDSNITYTGGGSPSPKIYKDIYGVVDGVFGKIERVEGQYVSAREESYQFFNL